MNLAKRLFLSLRRNKRKTIFLFFYFLLNIAAILIAFNKYWDVSLPAQIARASAAAIYVNFALIFLSVSRVLLSTVIKTKLKWIVPLEKYLTFHKVCGYGIFAFGLIHTTAYVFIFSNSETGFINKITSNHFTITGIILLVLLAIVTFFSIDSIRKSKLFELFFASHLLVIPITLLMFFHAKQFYYLAGFPLLVYSIDRIIRFRRLSRPLRVSSLKHLDDGTLEIITSKPAHCRHAPGDYAYLYIPALSRVQLHPFTISSSPEEDELSFHIKPTGGWTKRLQNLCSQQNSLHHIYIDGPFSTPSAFVDEIKYSLLIAVGSGITPFRSAIAGFIGDIKNSHDFTPKKMSLHWLVRDPKSLLIFGNSLLCNLPDWIDMHLYLLHTNHGMGEFPSNIILHVDKPNWDQIFAEVSKEKANKRPYVFYCGPNDLGVKLRSISRKHKLKFKKENF